LLRQHHIQLVFVVAHWQLAKLGGSAQHRQQGLQRGKGQWQGQGQ
jgi:hypothetical protein